VPKSDEMDDAAVFAEFAFLNAPSGRCFLMIAENESVLRV
jgi:hypothetical protein